MADAEGKDLVSIRRVMSQEMFPRQSLPPEGGEQLLKDLGTQLLMKNPMKEKRVLQEDAVAGLYTTIPVCQSLTSGSSM